MDVESRLVYKFFNLRRSSSVGQSARLIFVMSGVQIPPPLPRIIIVIIDILTYLSFSDRGVEQLGSSSGS